MGKAKKAVVYGGGNIGRGFLGQLLYESGYETVFVDIDHRLIDELNRRGGYPIRIVSNEEVKEIRVENVRAVTPDHAPAEIAGADILFTSAGVPILPKIAPVIRAGLDLREKGIDIIICENLIGADDYLRGLVGAQREDIGYVEASVGRMVPVMTDEMREGDITRVWVEPYCTLPVDRSAFRNPIPDIRGMVPSGPFAYFIQSKLYLHNMGHAVAAYMGMQKGIEFIWQAMEDAEISKTVSEAMEASARALALEHGKSLTEVEAYAGDLQRRFRNRYLGDTTKRVGRDTKRKLAPDDRLLGALTLCQKHGIKADAIKTGIMAALDYLWEG